MKSSNESSIDLSKFMDELSIRFVKELIRLANHKHTPRKRPVRKNRKERRKHLQKGREDE